MKNFKNISNSCEDLGSDSEVEEEICEAVLRSGVESLAHQKSQLGKYKVEERKVVMTELTL